jgi:hypothetical protein
VFSGIFHRFQLSNSSPKQKMPQREEGHVGSDTGMLYTIQRQKIEMNQIL